MMKLRLANPEHLIDINDLTELAYIREDDGEIRIGALTRHVDLLEVRPARRALPAVPRRRAGDRRPGRAQPRHDRRLAVPGRRGRGPLRRLHGRQGARRDPRRRTASASSSMEDFHVGPYMTAVGAGEMLTEVRLPLRPGAGSAHEKVERRAGDWAIAAASAAVWIEGGTIADAGIALSAVGLTTIHLTRAEELLRGKPPSEELFAQARRDRVARTARRAPTAAGRSTTSATSPASSPSARCAARPRARDRRPEHERLDDRQRRAGHRTTSSRACCSCTSSARRRAAPAPTGAATPPTAAPASCCMDGKPVKSCTILAAMCDGHEIRTVESLEVNGKLDPDPAGLPRAARAAVRVLHPGDADDRARAARREPGPDRARDPHRDLRRHLPLHGLQEHRRRRPLGGRARSRRDAGGLHMAQSRTSRARPPSARSASAA